MRGRLTVVAAVALVATTACSGSTDGSRRDDAGGDAGGNPPAGVRLSFGQLRNDEGTGRAQLRVVNASAEDLDVTGVGLDWTGFGEVLRDYETVVGAGRTLDLRFTLPRPRCRPTGEDVLGRLRLATGDGVRIVAAPLDATGAGYVTRIHERWCADLDVARAVTVTYSDIWRLLGAGRRARLVGEVGLERRAATEPVTLTSLRGSVLLETHLSGPVRLPADRERSSSRLVLTVPRCDEHAFIDTSQTFHFLAGVRRGPGPVTAVYRLPGAPTRQAAERLLDEACVVDGAID